MATHTLQKARPDLSMALISQNWTRRLLKESGRLTGDERKSETNKRQIQKKNGQTGRKRRVEGGLENNQRGKAVGEKSHRGTTEDRGGENREGGGGKKISLGMVSWEVKCY